MAKKGKHEIFNDSRCSFCGKSRSMVKRMVGGSNAGICDECLQLCNDILKQDMSSDSLLSLDSLPTPKQFRIQFDDYIIGQDHAKKVLAVAVYNHYKRVIRPVIDGVTFGKNNILLVGPTGSGKTLLAQTLARFLSVPFAIADATSLTEAGYVGEDVENIIQKLVQRADQDVGKAERGIVYIDEIDKIARKSDNPSITRDVSGEGVQQALLKLIEGTSASVNPQGGRKHPNQDTVTVDTTNILFICGGAFDGLSNIIANRISSTGMGFSSSMPGSSADHLANEELLAKVEPDDLIRYGLIPELVGRLPVVASLEPLSVADLVKVFKEPKDSLLRQYVALFAMENINLVFRADAIKRVAELAFERNTGARGLRSISERCLLDSFYHAPTRARDREGEIIVDAKAINGEREPVFKFLPRRQQASG